jgi:hypothetical protein
MEPVGGCAFISHKPFPDKKIEYGIPDESQHGRLQQPYLIGVFIKQTITTHFYLYTGMLRKSARHQRQGGSGSCKLRQKIFL